MQNNNLNLADAEPQTSYKIIPDGTIAKVKLHINKGDYNDDSEGWTDDFATQGQSGAVFLKCEYTVVEGEYEDQKVWSLIGLHSPKSDKYKQMGRSFMRGICDSSSRLDPNDKSTVANNIRNNFGFNSLDGAIFLAKIEVEKDKDGNDRNAIRYAVTKGHPEYDELMRKDNGRYKIGEGKKEQEPDTDVEDDELPF